MDISVSDFRTFLRCRRQWDLTSPNRQALVRPMSTKSYFFLGSVVHEAIDRMANGTYTSHDLLDAIVEAEINEYEKQYKAAIGVGFSMGEREVFNPDKELARSILEMYFDHYEKNDYREVGLGEGTLGPRFSYVHSEITFQVPIPTTNGYLRGTMDGVAINNETGQIWIVEHKTYQRPPKLDNLLLDDQFRCYQWAFQQLTGSLARGIIYDGMLKKAPTVPKVLKDGSLSRRDIDTTVKTYRNAVLNAGLNVEDYEDVIEGIQRVESSAENPFFSRHFIGLAPTALEETEKLLIDLYNEMNDPELRIYPNRPFSGCYDCGVRSICDAMTMGDDVDLAREAFIVAEPYHTFADTNPWTPDSGFKVGTTPLWQVGTVAV